MNKKLLVIGIVALFIGMTFVPAGASANTRVTKFSHVDEKIYGIYLFIGTLNGYEETEGYYKITADKLVVILWIRSNGLKYEIAKDRDMEFSTVACTMHGITTQNFMFALLIIR